MTEPTPLPTLLPDVVASLVASATDPATAIACHRAVGDACEPPAPQQGDTAGADRVETDGEEADGLLVSNHEVGCGWRE